MRVVPEILLVANEDKLALGVEPAMKTGAAGTRRYHDHQRVLGGVILRGRIDVVEGFSGMNIKVSCVERLDQEANREEEGVDPVPVVSGKHGGAEES